MKLWHVNSTARGGGVAEILDALRRYSQRPGASALEHVRFVIEPDDELFATTKRLHHRLHGVALGDLPTAREHALFQSVARQNAARLAERLRDDDAVLLHDPQTLPMAPLLAEAGIPVAWRCHVGSYESTAVSEETWAYLARFWPPDMPLIFSHSSLVPPRADGRRVEIIAPSIDPTTAKNRLMERSEIDRVLAGAGLTASSAGRGARRHLVIAEEPVRDEPVVLQVSRWDPLKDMGGVLRAFAESSLPTIARLVLCGPSPDSIADDPEANVVLQDVIRQRQHMPARVRRRVHLVCTDLDDDEGNALLVNALQRRATVVTQRSRQEAFGLTVTEAMFKGRAVVASKVGGISSQITHGRTGFLLDRPDDDDQFTAAILRLILDSAEAAAIGRAAAAHASCHYVTARENADHCRIFGSVAGRRVLI